MDLDSSSYRRYLVMKNTSYRRRQIFLFDEIPGVMMIGSPSMSNGGGVKKSMRQVCPSFGKLFELRDY